MNVQTDAAGRIDQGITCIHCGYNLRGLGLNAGCPECNTPVGKSIQGDLLHLSEPKWLAKLHRGTIWIQWVAVVPIFVLVLSGIGIDLLQRSKVITVYEAKRLGALQINVLPWLAAAIVGLIGCWKITTADPGKNDNASSNMSSRVTRFIVVSMFFAWLGAVCLAFNEDSFHGGGACQ